MIKLFRRPALTVAILLASACSTPPQNDQAVAPGVDEPSGSADAVELGTGVVGSAVILGAVVFVHLTLQAISDIVEGE